ncbi:hypothetical protein PP715_23015 [Ralstonia solanacearum]|uniref:hypothetical protein n=1 Tax=Ralstonia solanacearum TaxID=305 RepID=UPI0005AC7646|nr:hypothetical protein [Ralstonia solanacearum]AMP70058.1 hypothetical protein UW163_11545 [Ralstonia solanacearum]MBB6587274.1 hypothetical protein [Ralstonia solanacearum]MCL9842691.1 hypothetical protein [Ralstonia solanacearum]MDB0534819.1 hypothetical protein [Ralstonia solanacearum]MDB0539572.1 hypothetical protein [Ralstonia solanacearum]
MSKIFHLLFALAMIGLIAGMIKPAWVMRKSTTPSRKKIAQIALPALIVTAVLSNVTRTPEEIAHDQQVAEEKAVAKREENAAKRAEKAQHEATEPNSDGKKLYTYFKSVSGNRDTPRYNEQEYLRGRLISRCKVNGKPRGYYGWIEFRTVFLEGNRLKNAQPERLYVFAVASDDNVSAMWRGEQYQQTVLDQMRQTCD